MCILQYAGSGMLAVLCICVFCSMPAVGCCILYMCILQHAGSGMLAVLCICVFCSMLAVGCWLYCVYVYSAACWQWDAGCIVYMCILQHAGSGVLAVGMRCEAVDRLNPHLICVATIGRWTWYLIINKYVNGRRHLGLYSCHWNIPKTQQIDQFWLESLYNPPPFEEGRLYLLYLKGVPSNILCNGQLRTALPQNLRTW